MNKQRQLPGSLLGCLLGVALISLSAAAQTTAPNQWAWMGGSQVPYDPGVYGTLGVFAAANIPGSRLGAATWTDNKGHLWLFGGSEGDENGIGFQNDLWEFNPATNQWAWIGGSQPDPNSSGPAGKYTSSSAVPGAGLTRLLGSIAADSFGSSGAKESTDQGITAIWATFGSSTHLRPSGPMSAAGTWFAEQPGTMERRERQPRGTGPDAGPTGSVGSIRVATSGSLEGKPAQTLSTISGSTTNPAENGPGWVGAILLAHLELAHSESTRHRGRQEPASNQQAGRTRAATFGYLAGSATGRTPWWMASTTLVI